MGANSDDPTVVIEWLRRCSVGGVHAYTREGVQFTPWSRVLADVTRVAAHLADRGVSEGLRIAIRAHNTYEWLVLELALLQLRAVPVPVPVPDFAGTTNAELMDRFALAAVFVGREAWDQDGGGCEDGLVPMERLLALPPFRVRDVGAPKGARVCGRDAPVYSLAFSSGTSGRIKCLLLGWSGVAAELAAHSAAYPLRAEDRILIALPLSTFQQRYLCYLAIRNDCGIVLTTTELFLHSLQAARPTVLLGPPNFYEWLENRHENWSAGRRKILAWAAAPAVLLPSATLRRAWRRRVYRPLHEMFGGAVRLMLVGSAPTKVGTLDFFGRTGFELYQIYGLTETGYIAWNRRGANRRGTVGREVYPGSVETAPDGEILVRHPWHLCVGYEGEPAEEVTKVLLAPDLIATGDLGEFDRKGFLLLKGRKKNVVVTRGGQKLQLEELEEEFCQGTGVQRAAAYLCPDGLTLVVWHEADPVVVAAGLRELIERQNVRLGHGCPISRVLLLPGPLQSDSPLLNRNLKLDREAVRIATAHRAQPLATWLAREHEQ